MKFVLGMKIITYWKWSWLWESVADEPEKKHRKGHSILQTWSIVWKARNGFLKAEIQSVCETCWGCPLVLGSGGWGGGDLQSPAQAGWDPVSHLTPVCSLLNVCFKPGHLQLLLPHIQHPNVGETLVQIDVLRMTIQSALCLLPNKVKIIYISN